MPKFIHFDTVYQICSDSQEALHLWTICKSDTHVLQKYIVPNKKNLHKLRVYWKAKAGLHCFTVSSLFAMPRIKAKPKKKNTEYVGIYQHKITDYTYAGRLFRASFDPSLPNRSEILKKFEEYQNGTDFDEISENSGKNFLIRFSDKFNNIIAEAPVVDQVKDMVNVIIQVINSGARGEGMYEIGKRGVLDDVGNLMASEVIADFIQGLDGNYYLICCKCHKMDYMPTKYGVLFPMKTLSSTYFSRMDEESFKSRHEPFLTVKSLTNRLAVLGKKSSEFLKKKGNLLSPDDSEKSLKDIYLNNFSVTPRCKRIKNEENSNVYSEQITEIALHYDKVRLMARRNKAENKRRKTLERADGALEITVKKVLERIESNLEFKNIAEDSGVFFSHFLVDALDDGNKTEFFIRFQKELDWKISPKQFRVISAIITEECYRAQLFKTYEFAMLNKSIQQLESFIFSQRF